VGIAAYRKKSQYAGRLPFLLIIPSAALSPSWELHRPQVIIELRAFDQIWEKRFFW
jgi:hypothetical protein